MKQNNCSSCGSVFPSTTSFCPSCGAVQNTPTSLAPRSIPFYFLFGILGILAFLAFVVVCVLLIIAFYGTSPDKSTEIIFLASFGTIATLTLLITIIKYAQYGFRGKQSRGAVLIITLLILVPPLQLIILYWFGKGLYHYVGLPPKLLQIFSPNYS